VVVNLRRERTNVQSVLATLTAAEARGHSLWANIRQLDIHETPVSIRPVVSMHTIGGKDMRALRALLLHCGALDIVHAHNMSASLADELAHAHGSGTSLVHLHIRLPGPYSLGPIGKLHHLRRLSITTQNCGLNFFPSRVDAWSLPNLEELRWEDLPANSYFREPEPESMVFLAACRFPQMRETELRVPNIDMGNGPELLRVFLQAHEAIESLTIVLLEATCAVAFGAPGTRLRRLSLQECGDVWASLVGQIPSTTWRLDLPVFWTPGSYHRDGLEVTSTVLGAILNRPRNIGEIHLAVGYRLHEKQGTRRAFRFAEPPESSNQAEMIQHDMIRQCAVNLGAHGVKVYDECGMTVLD
jgi:hypothetical protein